MCLHIFGTNLSSTEINVEKDGDFYEEINKKEVYGIFFTSFEECQEFCSYLNKKEGVAGYDYDREGNLIAESTGEDNE